MIFVVNLKQQHMTAQFGETLKYNGVNYYLATEPLEPYLEKHNIKFYAWCTACWRGYTSKWSIEDGMLYLKNTKFQLYFR